MWDVHAHHVPLAALREATGSSRLGVRYNPTDRVLTRPSGSTRPVSPKLTDLLAGRENARQQGIDVQVLSPWLDLTDHALPEDQARAWSRVLNDAMAAAIDGRSEFRGMAALPLGNAGDAARELERAVEELGFLGGIVDTRICGKGLIEADLEALFEAATALRAVLFLHPFEVLGREQLESHFMTNICGNPFDTTVAALDLVWGGVFERHPGLRVLLAHGGGTLPYIAGRAAHGSRAVVHGPGFDADDVLRLFHFDTVLHDPRSLAFAVDRVGTDRVVAGTDIPFPMAVDHVRGHIEKVERILQRSDLIAAFTDTTRALFDRTA